MFQERKIDIKQGCGTGVNGYGVVFTPPAPISCRMQNETDVKELDNPAVTFLQEHGNTSIVSLGCGKQINRIDNHLRIMKELNLNYYVCIDCGPYIELVSDNLFMDPDDMTAMLSETVEKVELTILNRYK